MVPLCRSLFRDRCAWLPDTRSRSYRNALGMSRNGDAKVPRGRKLCERWRHHDLLSEEYRGSPRNAGHRETPDPNTKTAAQLEVIEPHTIAAIAIFFSGEIYRS
jgi:hypothetical protein